MIEGAECECGKKLVPFRKLCPKCGKEMAKAQFEGKGIVITHTTLYTVPEGFEGPIKLVMVGIEGGANLICGYEGETNLNIGDNVKIRRKGELHICEPIR